MTEAGMYYIEVGAVSHTNSEQAPMPAGRPVGFRATWPCKKCGNPSDSGEWTTAGGVGRRCRVCKRKYNRARAVTAWQAYKAWRDALPPEHPAAKKTDEHGRLRSRSTEPSSQ